MEEVVLGVGGGEGTTKGVFGDARTAGDHEGRGVANGGARVPEILTAAELEGFVAGVVGPELLGCVDGRGCRGSARTRHGCDQRC